MSDERFPVPDSERSTESTIEDFRVVRSDGVEVPHRTRERRYAELLLADREARGGYQPYKIQRRVTTVGEWEDCP